MRVPPVTDELLRRLVSTSRAFWVQGAKLIQDRPGNPFGMHMMGFGDAVAIATPGRADVHWMNMTEFVWPAEAGLVPEILSFYRKHAVAPTITLPSSGDPSTASRGLVSAGLHPWRTLAVLYGLAVSPMPGPTDLAVRPISSGEIGVFGTAWADGYELVGQEREWALGDIVAWPSREGVTLYLAEAAGTPAGAAVLGVRDGVGYLANASTLPAYRRRGAHGAMIERRIADAAAAGCDLVCGLALYGSTSQNNMERLGLRLAGTVTQWRPLPST